MDSLKTTEKQIREIVDRETRAWNTRDVNLLLTIFHKDMVWPWPKTPQSHNPIDWELVQGKFDYRRWKKGWQRIFETYNLVHNIRKIRKIVISKERDGAFAVVDIDTLWRNRNGDEMLWKGRVCKVYSKVGNEWKMTMHTGVLEYS